MQKRDILHEIYFHKITENEAQNLLDQFIDDELGAIAERLGLSLGKEYTAIIMHDISFATVAKWRYEGWPTTCAICGKDLNLEKGWWRAVSEITVKDIVRKDVMTHWDCYEKYY